MIKVPPTGGLSSTSAIARALQRVIFYVKYVIQNYFLNKFKINQEVRKYRCIAPGKKNIRFEVAQSNLHVCIIVVCLKI
jgi:hypothetical protein